MKYIVLKVKAGNNYIELPIIFPNLLVHKQVAEQMQHCIMLEHQWTSEVVAAGSRNMDGECYGKSETLGVGSRPQDTQLIHSIDYTHGHI